MQSRQRGGTSRRADKHGEPRVDVQQSGTAEGGRTATGSNLGGENRVLGDEHPDTLTTMSNLAHALKSQGQDKNAVALMKNAVNLLIKHLGPLCRSNHLCSPIV